MTFDEPPVPSAPLFVIGGVQADGKAEVARMLAARFEGAVLIEGAVMRRMVAGGADVELPAPTLEAPTPELSGQAESLLFSGYDVAIALADRYVMQGRPVVMEDFMIGRYLDEFLRMLPHRPFHLVVIAPDPDKATFVYSERDSDDRSAKLGTALREVTSDIGVWVDHSRITAEQAASVILGRLPDSAIY